VVVVANPMLFSLTSLVKTVVSHGTSPRFVLIKARPVLIVDKKDIFKEIVHAPRRSEMVAA